VPDVGVRVFCGGAQRSGRVQGAELIGFRWKLRSGKSKGCRGDGVSGCGKRGKGGNDRCFGGVAR